MIRITWVMLLVAVTMTASVMAADLSNSILNAGHWPKPSKLPPGAEKIWAPPGTITTVELHSKGTFRGTNSKGHWVWALPFSDVYSYIRACNCDNPITGSKPKEKPVVIKVPQLPKPEPTTEIYTSNAPEPEEQVVIETPTPVFYVPATRLGQIETSPRGLPEWETKSREALTLTVATYPQTKVVTIKQPVNPPHPPPPPPPPGPYCPPGDPPVKPPTDPGTNFPGAGEPSWIEPNQDLPDGYVAPGGPPPPTGDQSPVVIGPPEGPPSWMPDLDDPTVADPVTEL